MRLLVNNDLKHLVCSQCGNLVPVGHKYWESLNSYKTKVHMNCVNYMPAREVNITEFEFIQEEDYNYGN